MATDEQKGDEVINVTLPKKDYEQLRTMIERDRSLSVVGRYVRNVLLVAAGGFITLVAFWDQLKRLLTGGQ